MPASAPRPRRPRFRAPPPTPIKTAKGARSAAVDDRVLADYLETSLRVPDLTLPRPRPLSLSLSLSHSRSSTAISAAPPEELPLPSLLRPDAAALRRAVAAASASGGFSIAAAASAAEEVRSAVDSGKQVFGIGEERKREMERWFRRRDVVGEEFYCYRHRPGSAEAEAEADRMLEAALPGSYRALREKLEKVAAKMDLVAESVARILSQNSKDQKQPVKIRMVPSVLCLTQYNSNQLRADWSEFGTACAPHSYALSLHVSPCDQEFCLRSSEGSTFFKMPAGNIFVTIGKQLQEWSGGEFKSATGEIIFELTDDPDPFFSLEFFYLLEELHPEVHNERTISILDQLFMMILLFAFYCFWFWIPHKLPTK
ncbi:hypothetical protein ACMD2_12133 [Ananas comosus]|nr:hypothetical protein ACMD2_12133 [Ananas comosus]